MHDSVRLSAKVLWADTDRLGPRNRRPSTPAIIGSGLGCARAPIGRTAPLDLRRPLEYGKCCHSTILPWNDKDPFPHEPLRADTHRLHTVW